MAQAASAQATSESTGGPHGGAGVWIATFLIIIAWIIGAFALINHSVPLWIATGVCMVIGGVLALVFRIMDQVH